MSYLFPFGKASPESQGMRSAAITEFVEAVNREKYELHGLIISRHEKIIAEGYWAPYTKDDPQRLYSVAKSVNLTAILIMIQEGLLHPDDRMCELLPYSMPSPMPERLGRMKLRHLLSMSTGHGADAMKLIPGTDEEVVRSFFASPLEYEPGEKFFYNNGVPTVLEYICRKFTGRGLGKRPERGLTCALHISGCGIFRRRFINILQK